MFLAIISVFAGLIPFGHFVSATGESYDIHIDWSVATTSIVAAVIGISLATWMYAGKEWPVADKLERTFPKLHKAALNRFYIDDAWQYFTHKIVFRCFSRPIAWFDRHVVDNTFNFRRRAPMRLPRASARGRVATSAAMPPGSSPVLVALLLALLLLL